MSCLWGRELLSKAEAHKPKSDEMWSPSGGFFSACWKKLPFTNLEWVSCFYLFLFKVIVSGLLCHSAGSSARRWASGLAAGCILSGTVRIAPLIPLIRS